MFGQTLSLSEEVREIRLCPALGIVLRCGCSCLCGERLLRSQE